MHARAYPKIVCCLVAVKKYFDAKIISKGVDFARAAEMLSASSASNEGSDDYAQPRTFLVGTATCAVSAGLVRQFDNWTCADFWGASLGMGWSARN